MTFNDLREQWMDVRAIANDQVRERTVRAFRHSLTAPDQRRWFRVGRNWLHGPRLRLDLDPHWVAELFPHDYLRWMAGLQLELIRTAAMHHWTSCSLPTEVSLQEVLQQFPPPAGAKPVTLAEARDMVHELCAAPPAGSSEPVPEHTGGRQWNLSLRPVERGADGHPRAVTVQFLLAWKGGGSVARLTLELVREGHGDIYPVAPLAYQDFDQDFADAFDLAREWATTELKTWPRRHDIRWRVGLPDERLAGERVAGEQMPWPDQIGGPSVGLACGLGLAVLLDPPDSERGRLAAELSEVAATGALVDASGQLNAVGAVNLEQKLGPAFAVAVERKLIRALLYHHSNDASVPGKWKPPGSSPQAMPIHTLDEALTKLCAELGPKVPVREATLARAQQLSFLGGIADIAEAYQPIRLSYPPPLPQPGQREEAPKPPEPLPFDQIFTDYAGIMERAGRSGQTVPQLVVTSDPGNGKSVLLQHVAWMAAQRRAPYDRYLPVRFELRKWHEWWSAQNSTQPRTLAHYLAAVPYAKGVKVEDWQRWLARGELLLLADGLETIPSGDFLRELERAVAQWAKHGNAFVLVCRTRNFDTHHEHFKQYALCDLQPFTDPQRDDFIRRYPKLTTEQADQLLADLKRNAELARLATRPATLDLACYLVVKGKQLSGDRRELWSSAVATLLERPREEAPEAAYPNQSRPSLAAKREVLARTLFELYQARGKLAFTETQFHHALRRAVQAARGDTKGLPDWVDAYQHEFTQRSRLVSLDEGKVLDDRFLEFLAGEGLALEEDFATQADAVIEDAVKWREVIPHACWQKAVQHLQARDVWQLVEKLAGETVPGTDLGWRKVILAGEVLLDLKEHLGLERSANQATLKCVKEQLAAMIELESLPENRKHRAGLPVLERSRGADVLGWLGDPRPGVGLRRDGLPDLRFTCELSAGDFKQGETGKVVRIAQPYRLAIYPVTVVQYAAFVKDGGYEQREFWTEAEAARVWRRNAEDGKGEVEDLESDEWWRGPMDYDDERFRVPSHPVVGVNWSEAVAFCRWLTERLRELPTGDARRLGKKQEIRLAHEAEWEQVARWNTALRCVDDRQYPWDPWGAADRTELSARCNWMGTGIGSTSAVGLFPLGQAECGALDLSGNVWEWCDHGYHHVLRGGSWNSSPAGGLLRGFELGGRFNYNGFRLVLVGGEESR